MYFKPGMYYSILATSEHPVESAMLIDYLLNDPEAAEILLSDRGLPACRCRLGRRDHQAHQRVGPVRPGDADRGGGAVHGRGRIGNRQVAAGREQRLVRALWGGSEPAGPPAALMH